MRCSGATYETCFGGISVSRGELHRVFEESCHWPNRPFLGYSLRSTSDIWGDHGAGLGFRFTARSKGIKERKIIKDHALRNALIPIITLIGINIPVLFSGAIMIEQVFQWPGLGTLFNTAVSQRDYSLLMGLSFFSSLIVLLSNLLTDIAYAVVDPRIRYE